MSATIGTLGQNQLFKMASKMAAKYNFRPISASNYPGDVIFGTRCKFSRQEIELIVDTLNPRWWPYFKMATVLACKEGFVTVGNKHCWFLKFDQDIDQMFLGKMSLMSNQRVIASLFCCYDATDFAYCYSSHNNHRKSHVYADLEPLAVAVSPYGWLMTQCGCLAG